MSMPFYVSPEQVMKDKADYARKRISQIRSGVVMTCEAGILFVAPNPSRALRKFSEMYDRIAFAAVGRYNEFESLRKAGVRYADMTGFQYDRRDVTARGLADWYAQLLGALFTDGPKPYEVEIVVAEVGADRRRRRDLPDHLRRLGGRGARLRRDGRPGRQGRGRAQGAVHAGHVADRGDDGWRWPRWPARATAASAEPLTSDQLEVALLERSRPHRAFRRLTGARLDGAAGRGQAGAAGAGRQRRTSNGCRDGPPARRRRATVS